MVDTSRVDGPTETVRPKIGIGAPGAPGGGAKVLTFGGINPAEHVGNEVTRQLALSVVGQLMLDTARSLQGITGLSDGDMALVLTGVRDQFSEVIYPAPPG